MQLTVGYRPASGSGAAAAGMLVPEAGGSLGSACGSSNVLALWASMLGAAAASLTHGRVPAGCAQPGQTRGGHPAQPRTTGLWLRMQPGTHIADLTACVSMWCSRMALRCRNSE